MPTPNLLAVRWGCKREHKDVFLESNRLDSRMVGGALSCLVRASPLIGAKGEVTVPIMFFYFTWPKKCCSTRDGMSK